MKIKHVLMAPAGEGEGGGGEGDAAAQAAAAAKAAAEAQEARFTAMEKAVGLVAQSTQALNEGLTALTTKIESLGKPETKKQSSGTGFDDNDVDLETMDRKTFAAYIGHQLRGMVQEAMKPVSENLGKLDEKIDGNNLSILIKDFQKDHPDFFEWKDEMKVLLKENPTLTPARVYALARVENAEKAKKIDEKYGLGQAGDKAKNGEAVLFSMFPSGSGSSATKGAGKMSPKQAAEAAWDQVMSGLQG